MFEHPLPQPPLHPYSPYYQQRHKHWKKQMVEIPVVLLMVIPFPFLTFSVFFDELDVVIVEKKKHIVFVVLQIWYNTQPTGPFPLMPILQQQNRDSHLVQSLLCQSQSVLFFHTEGEKLHQWQWLVELLEQLLYLIYLPKSLENIRNI